MRRHRLPDDRLVVHGLWTSYSDQLKRATGRNQKDQGPDGLKLVCTGSAYDQTSFPGGVRGNLELFPRAGVSADENEDFHEHEYNKHGKCAQMTQTNYWNSALTLGTRANQIFAPIVQRRNNARPTQISLAALKQCLGLAQPRCYRIGNTGRAALWFINFCYKRTSGVGGPVACPTPTDTTTSCEHNRLTPAQTMVDLPVQGA